jgi:hypothetical protein
MISSGYDPRKLSPDLLDYIPHIHIFTMRMTLPKNWVPENFHSVSFPHEHEIDFCNMPNLLDTLFCQNIFCQLIVPAPRAFRVRKRHPPALVQRHGANDGMTEGHPALPHPSDQEPLKFSACGLFMSTPFLCATWYNITAGFVIDGIVIV